MKQLKLEYSLPEIDFTYRMANIRTFFQSYSGPNKNHQSVESTADKMSG